MPNPFFKFKQFTVYHDRCAMKVGTDGVLLGSYVSLPSAGRVLDVGTGTGLVAMMIAQRGTSNLKIDAIEIDKDASEQAAENIGKTAWSNRIRVINSDFTEFCPQQKYDLIVSNPPYFENSLRCTATN
ncbi:MAG: methyltransferase, partial [Bacteroides sp.]|nr:methyltransferase [Bacteroides sp.]